MPGPPRLRARPDGGGWRLDGDAPWVTGWGLIDLLLVVARGPDDSVVSLILDAAAQPGLTVTRERLAAVNASVTVRRLERCCRRTGAPDDGRAGAVRWPSMRRDRMASTRLRWRAAWSGVRPRPTGCRRSADDELAACRGSPVDDAITADSDAMAAAAGGVTPGGRPGPRVGSTPGGRPRRGAGSAAGSSPATVGIEQVHQRRDPRAGGAHVVLRARPGSRPRAARRCWSGWRRDHADPVSDGVLRRAALAMRVHRRGAAPPGPPRARGPGPGAPDDRRRPGRAGHAGGRRDGRHRLARVPGPKPLAAAQARHGPCNAGPSGRPDRRTGQRASRRWRRTQARIGRCTPGLPIAPRHGAQGNHRAGQRH